MFETKHHLAQFLGSGSFLFLESFFLFSLSLSKLKNRTMSRVDRESERGEQHSSEVVVISTVESHTMVFLGKQLNHGFESRGVT